MSMTTPVPSVGRRISFQPEAIFQSLVQEGETVDVWLFLHNKEVFDVEIDQPNHTGITALHQSVLNNNLDIAKILLNSGADVNTADVNGVTPLHTASACGFLHMASLLVLFGASLFARTDQGDAPVDFAKDGAMTMLLHNEMIRQIHSKHFLTSLAMYYIKHWYVRIKRALAVYIKHVISVVSAKFCELTRTAKRVKVITDSESDHAKED